MDWLFSCAGPANNAAYSASCLPDVNPCPAGYTFQIGERKAYRIVLGPRCRIDGIEGLRLRSRKNPDTFVYGKGANTADGVPDERFHFFSPAGFLAFFS